MIRMDIKESFKLKPQVATTKVIGLVLSWDILALLSGWIVWGDIANPIFYSLIWLNLYLFITVTDVKKSGIGMFFAEIFNVVYNDMLDDRAKLNKAKESLGTAANFLSMKELMLVEKEKAEELKAEKTGINVPEMLDNITDALLPDK